MEENERSVICLCATEKQDLWHIDSGSSKHITSCPTMFIKLKDNKGRVTFGNDKPSKIIGKGTVIINSKIKAENVLLVENLKLNLLSLSQTCDQGHICIFYSKKCEIGKNDLGRIVCTAVRNSNNVYILENEINDT